MDGFIRGLMQGNIKLQHGRLDWAQIIEVLKYETKLSKTYVVYPWGTGRPRINMK